MIKFSLLVTVCLILTAVLAAPSQKKGNVNFGKVLSWPFVKLNELLSSVENGKLPNENAVFKVPLQNNSAHGKFRSFFQDDINLNEEKLNELLSSRPNDLAKTFWPNNTVPYALSFDHSEEQHAIIEDAIKRIEAVSCLKFIRRTDERPFIQIIVNKSDNFCGDFSIMSKISIYLERRWFLFGAWISRWCTIYESTRPFALQ